MTVIISLFLIYFVILPYSPLQTFIQLFHIYHLLADGQGVNKSEYGMSFVISSLQKIVSNCYFVVVLTQLFMICYDVNLSFRLPLV